MSSINGTSGVSASAALNSPQEATPAPSASPTVKINYGDPARAAGLQNMLTKMQQLTSHAESIVQARNATLQ